MVEMLEESHRPPHPGREGSRLVAFTRGPAGTRRADRRPCWRPPSSRKSLFNGDPFDLGICGGFALPGIARMIAQSDLVLAFGTSLSVETTGHGTMFPHARVVHIDVEATLARDQTVADRIVVGDARLTAERLLELAPSRRPGWRDQATAESIASVDRWEGVDFAEEPGFVNPYSAYRLCDGLLPAERLLLVDGGYFMGGLRPTSPCSSRPTLFCRGRFGGDRRGARPGHRCRRRSSRSHDGPLHRGRRPDDEHFRSWIPPSGAGCRS